MAAFFTNCEMNDKFETGQKLDFITSRPAFLIKGCNSCIIHSLANTPDCKEMLTIFTKRPINFSILSFRNVASRRSSSFVLAFISITNFSPPVQKVVGKIVLELLVPLSWVHISQNDLCFPVFY